MDPGQFCAFVHMQCPGLFVTAVGSAAVCACGPLHPAPTPQSRFDGRLLCVCRRPLCQICLSTRHRTPKVQTENLPSTGQVLASSRRRAHPARSPDPSTRIVHDPCCLLSRAPSGRSLPWVLSYRYANTQMTLQHKHLETFGDTLELHRRPLSSTEWLSASPTVLAH